MLRVFPIATLTTDLSICIAAGIVAVAAEVLDTGSAAGFVRTVKGPKAAVSVADRNAAVAAGCTKLEHHSSAEIVVKELAAGCTLSRHYMKTAELEVAEAHLFAGCSLTGS
jgi:hypothetical protein